MKRRYIISKHGVRAIVLSGFIGLAMSLDSLAALSQTIPGLGIDSPAHILDYHENDGVATTLRNGLLTDAGILITRSFVDPAHNADYRMIYSLFDDSGSALKLVNGGVGGVATVAATAPVTVSLSGFSTVYSSTLQLYPDPVVTLDNKTGYFVRATLQTRPNVFNPWTTIASSEADSAESRVLHFTQAASGDADWNIGAVAVNPQWTKTHLLETDFTDNSFTTQFTVLFGRYDDWDLPVDSVDTTLTLDYDLIENSTGTQVPLEDDGIVSSNWSAASYKMSGGDKLPSFQFATPTANIRPLSQLNSGSETYILRCTIKHIEDAVGTEATDATCELAPEGLLHFNGNIHFGPIAAAFDEFSTTPNYGTTGANYVNSLFRIANGHGILPLNPNLVFGNNVILFTRLKDNGDAVVQAGSASETVYDPLAPAAAVAHTTDCLTYTYGAVSLRFDGMSTSSISVDLPQGLIYLPDTTVASHHGESTFSSPGTIPLAGTGNLASATTINLPANAGIVDESHPLRFGVGEVTLLPVGQLLYTAVNSVEYIHDAALTKLEDDLTNGQIDATDSEGRRLDQRSSNDQYWRGVNSLPQDEIYVRVAPDKSARMSSEFDMAAKVFKTHFPQHADVDWTSFGNIAIDNGMVSGASNLNGVNQVDLSYHKTCPKKVDPCADDVDKHKIEFVPDSKELTVTPTGGLYRVGSLNAAQQLEWGARGGVGGVIDPNYPYAHRTDTFAEGDFYMPGYQLYAADNPLLSTAPYIGAGGDTAPSALLLSGFNGNLSSPDINYPTENAYDIGTGHYPGLNFVVNTSGEIGASRLGGNQVDYPYELLDGGASKYYTRCAGIFGRQVGVDGSFNPSLNIYGYDFTLSSFQVSFQASEQHESWVNGSVTVTGHTNFTQKFIGLEMDCLGELDGAEMDPTDDSAKMLIHWTSTFVAKSMRFEKTLLTAPGTCPIKYNGFLTMGISTRAANIPTDLHGIFGFNASNGNLLTQTTGVDIGVDSELGLPAVIAMTSPAKDYNLVPTGKLRFSNPEEVPAAVGDPGGFVTFGATIDIPYFRDLQVQVMTSAGEIGDLHLAPGWDNGETFFSSKAFDPNHASWPKGLIPLAEYKTPVIGTDPTFLIKAEQDLFGLVRLSYPMQWNAITRTFKSMNPNHEELFVIEIDHQIDYLDSEATKISFGAKYEGLPEISLTNMLNSQIDAAAEQVSTAVTAPLKDALDGAFQEFEDFLADSLDAVVDPVIERAATVVLNPFYDDIKTHYDLARVHGDDWNQFKSDLDAEIQGQIYDSGFPNAASNLRDQLELISDVTEDAASVTNDLKEAIEFIILGIDVMVNQVDVNGSTPEFHRELSELNTPIGVVKDGMLKKTSGEYKIIANLIGLLLENLVEPEVAAVLGPLLDDLTSGLNSELNALLEEIGPVLDQITDALNQVREFLVEVYDIVDLGSDFIDDFKNLVQQAKSTLDGFQDIMDKPATRALAFMEDIAKANGIDIVAGTDRLENHFNLFQDFSKGEFVLLLKTELKDAIMQSKLIEQFQFLVRQTLYDFQLKFEQTVSTVLAQVTDVMKELISETIGALEDEINPMLGKVNDVMGAAEISGYAEINGDSLRKLRLDASMQMQIPDEMELNVFLEIISYTSEDGGNGCVDPGEKAVEVTIGAVDVPFDWISDGLRASLSVKMSLKDEGFGLRPNGVGGAFELTGGEISFQTFKITCLAATVAVGPDDCFLGARACAEFNSYQISIGVFFGKTCTVDPLMLVDADVAAVLNGPYPLIGGYVYGEVWLPISELVLGIPASCLFNISAGVGTGVGFFLDGNLNPVFVGKMFVGVSGEALCVVSIKGEVTLVGIVQDGSFSASGTGKLTGKVGWCPFCIKFGASAKITYTNGDWDVDL